MRRKRKDPPFENTVVEFSQKLAKGLGILADMLNSPERDIFVQHMLKDILAEEDKMTVRVLDQTRGSSGDLHIQMALLKDELERPRAFAPPFDRLPDLSNEDALKKAAQFLYWMLESSERRADELRKANPKTWSAHTIIREAYHNLRNEARGVSPEWCQEVWAQYLGKARESSWMRRWLMDYTLRCL